MRLEQHERLANLAMGCAVFVGGFLSALIVASVMIKGYP